MDRHHCIRCTLMGAEHVVTFPATISENEHMRRGGVPVGSARLCTNCLRALRLWLRHEMAR